MFHRLNSMLRPFSACPDHTSLFSGQTNRSRLFHFKLIPPQPVSSATAAGTPDAAPRISDEDVQLLERLSLVDFGDQEAVARLSEAVRFADQIRAVDTTGVEPLVSVLEDRCLRLRDDVVEESAGIDTILSNAAVSEDEYFVAPPGNIPLEPRPAYTE